MPIKVLPDHVINQISAGEVVERPSSVVRELVDNSVDAGSHDITVYIEAGGKSLIRVCDDGSGMSRDDALLAFERHATSKLREADDLLEINTLGFRGEALPSIASVSRLRLKTKQSESEVGTEVIIEGGNVKSVKQIACNNGTEIEVLNLFYNTPARRNFLKTNKTEELKIKQWLINFALVHPEVRFRLFIDGEEALNFPRRSAIPERAASIIRGSSVPVSYKNADYKIEGLVAHPSQAQSDSSSFMLYVNKRHISDKVIIRAVKEGFDSMLKEREFPVGYLSIEMPPQLVDVNVHPQKAEVRFRKPQDIFVAARSAVLKAVGEFKAPARVEMSAPKINRGFSSVTGSLALQVEPQAMQYAPQASMFSAMARESHLSRNDMPQFKYSDLNYIGQIFSCYLLCSLEEKFVVIDMHAAHERCNYNLIRKRINTSAAQVLLVPLIVEMTEIAVNNCIEIKDLLEDFGFEIEAFSNTSLAVRRIPGIMDQKSTALLMREISDLDIEEAASGRVKEKLDHAVARLACHASIRSGYKIKREEAYALFQAIDEAETAAACPHGRPVAVQFTEDEIEKWFGRDR